jgi:ArsR family transcriptional regulator
MHPSRIAILDVLREGDQCVCHLEAVLGLRQAYVSQQLAVLRDAGLVTDERDGLNIFYRVTNPSTFALLDIARAMTGDVPATTIAATPKAVCPCPKCNATP